MVSILRRSVCTVKRGYAMKIITEIPKEAEETFLGGISKEDIARMILELVLSLLINRLTDEKQATARELAKQEGESLGINVTIEEEPK